MITKAIIMNTPEPGDNLYKVRIPLFEETGNSSVLLSETAPTYDAMLCKTPGSTEGYAVGDIVFVDFEDNQYSNVTIMGKLYTGESESLKPKQELSVLDVDGTVALNGNVTINGVDLSKLNENTQALENLIGKTGNIDSDISELWVEVDGTKKLVTSHEFILYTGSRWEEKTVTVGSEETVYYEYKLEPYVYQWLLNTSLSISTNNTMTVSFTSNSITYTYIKFVSDSESNRMYYGNTNGDTLVYTNDGTDTWVSDSYKIVFLTVPTTTVNVLWFLSNATAQAAEYPELIDVKSTDSPIWDVKVDPTDTSLTYKNQIKYRAWCTTLTSYNGYLVIQATNKPLHDIKISVIGITIETDE